MTLRDYIVLAAEDDALEYVFEILGVVFFLVVVGLGSLIKKAQEKAERARRREQERRERGRDRQQVVREAPVRASPAEGPKPAQEAAAMLRELFGQRPEVPRPPPKPPKPASPPPPPPGARPARTGRPGDLSAQAQPQMRAEVQALRPAPAGARKPDRRRTREPAHLPATAGPAAGAGQAARRVRVLVDLHDRKEALRAIVYSEIIGPPKALRTDRERWDL